MQSIKFTLLLCTCFCACVPSISNGQAWVNLSNNSVLIEQNTTDLICYSTNSVYAIGQRDAAGNPSVIHWNGNSWTTIQSPSVFGNIGGTCPGKGKTYISGNMESYPGSNLAHQKVESWNGSNWEILGGSDSVFSASMSLKIFTDNNNNLYALGHSFSGGKNIVAKWDGAAWSQLGHLFTEDAPNTSYSYGGVAGHDGKIYVYGNFIDSNNTVFMQYWDGTNWQKLTDTVMNGDIRSAIVDNNDNLIISCTRRVSNQWLPYILRWDHTNWSQIGDINPLNRYGKLYADRNDSLYCLGTPLENGAYITHLTKLVNNQWEEFGGDANAELNTNRRITAVNLDTLNNLYVAGYYLDNPDSKYIVRYGVTDSSTSIAGLNVRPKEDFVIFPNPNNGSFNISFDKNSSYSGIAIYNISGAKVYQRIIANGLNMPVEISNFAKGVYILKLYKGEEAVTRQIAIR